MRNYILLLLILLLTINAGAQEHEDSEDEELDELFRPVPKAKVLNYTLPQIRIRKIRNYTPFQDLSHYSPEKNLAMIPNPNRNSFFYTIGSSGIVKTQVIKRGSIGNTHAILYRDSRYSQGKDVWLALYDPEQERWEKYYTGLTQSLPLHLKWDSQVPLFKDTHTVQIEAAYTRDLHLKENFFSILDLVQDGVVVEINIASIIADSDRDGLTDVQEERFMLNPKKSDSDGDGLIDSLDPNPRFSLPRTEFTQIYEEVYFFPNSLDNLFYPIPFMPLKYAMYALKGSDASTYLIVSDDKNIQGIGLSNYRLIILTTEEYKAQKDFGLKKFRQIHFSPISKIGGSKNLYNVRISSGSGGNSYTIRKSKNGWEYRHEYFWIT
ncbi:hypothetical protein H8S95_00085 [Pontibacter sp. KCTC 32443]|uniref:hypothetical protein n=1 Tax=Pontibacter TaxID=323449 RepID=UPI00164D1519|nr:MULTISPECIES: hypothetical protein [Pontibacter]MBC5772448.1 hypothetical protein [Pontibacter sp. KCTC 32443]